MQGGCRRRVGDCGWSSALRQVASRGEAHLRPSGEGGRAAGVVWRDVCGVWVMWGREKVPYVCGMQCGGLCRCGAVGKGNTSSVGKSQGRGYRCPKHVVRVVDATISNFSIAICERWGGSVGKALQVA